MMVVKDFLDSKLLAAVVAVLITAHCGHEIAGEIQKNSKKSELAIEAYKDHLQEQRQIIDDAFKLVGAVSGACQDITEITGERFVVSKRQGESQQSFLERKGIADKQVMQVQNKYNELRQNWDRAAPALDHWIDYYHDGNKGVNDSWRELGAVLLDYCDCVERIHDERRKGRAPASESLLAVRLECDRKYGFLQEDLRIFTGQLREVKRYAYEDLGLGSLFQEPSDTN